MINTNKKIHIYNRFRTIYTSKNRYYIRHNKKYIDLYTIIKKANQKGSQRGGGKKDKKDFLVQELNGIKDSIVIFKLLIDDKQSEAINIYLNLIELINSKKDLIINKINTYPLNYFDNELNKAAIITYVKNVLYNNIFDNYLLNIIPRIDIKNLIKGTDKDAIENIIKLLLHLNNNSDQRVLQDTMNKIEKYNEVIESTIKDNCNNYEALKNIIQSCIEVALNIVEEASADTSKEEEAQEVDEEEDEEDEDDDDGDEDRGEDKVSIEGDGNKGKEENAKTEAKAKKGKEKGAKEKKNKTTYQNEIKKVIDEEMDAIKEGLDNLENKDYLDKLLPVLEKESEYYNVFIDSSNDVFANYELQNYFNNIKEFLTDYEKLYKTNIDTMNVELGKKRGEEANIQQCIETNNTKIANEEQSLKVLKVTLEQDKIDYNDIKIREGKEVNNREDDAENDTDQVPVLQNGAKGGSKHRLKYAEKGTSKRYKIYRSMARIVSGGDRDGDEIAPVDPVNNAANKAVTETSKEGNDIKEQVKELKNKIKENNKIYANHIRTIRELKISGNELKKKIEKVKKKIETIEKKIKQYEEFLVKITDFLSKINTILSSIVLDKEPIETSDAKNPELEYGNIALYKKYIEIIIFNIKAKILHYFLDNYIQFCNDLNESRDNNKNKDNYGKLNDLIEELYKKNESDKSDVHAPNTSRDAPDTSVGAAGPVTVTVPVPDPNPIVGPSGHVTVPDPKADAADAAGTAGAAASAPVHNAADAADDAPVHNAANAAGATAPVADAAGAASGAGAGAATRPFKLEAPFGGVDGGGKAPKTGGKGKPRVCAYLTDVEGNLDFFEKYVRISKVIEWVDSKKNRLRFKQKDSMFVFGGDCQDRGIGDIRFVNLLLNFKSEYPDRVEFIIGNRDANKIRIYSEMSEKIDPSDINAKSKYLAKYDNFPYWVNKGERITLRKYLEDNNYKINAVSRLKYILDYTMGSNGCFDKRRKELSIILNKDPDSISDNDIITSFLNSVSPNPNNIKNTNDNYMLKYLKNGKIAYIFGEHIFVHGAVNKNNIGYIPNNKYIVDDVDKWVSGLNKWFQKDLKEYIANPEYGGISKKRKGYKIIDYAVPSDNKTVVYSDNLKNGNGQYINAKVIKYLNKGGIHSIISGHRPHGDCPLVLRSKKLTAVSADTSYSKKGHRSKWGIDNRGNAVSEVLLYFNGDIQVHGILQDKRKYDYIIKNKETKPANPDKPDKHAPKYDKYIGLQLKNNYWVKNVRYAKNAKNAKYLISYAKGFEYDEKWITEAEMLKLL